ncbi:MAG: ATP-binding cassette domain-containing protein, partial [Planctomycetota bacterium]|nr:ATP-binding cassette domain-containing protein [Planctomycetota bacterium]
IYRLPYRKRLLLMREVSLAFQKPYLFGMSVRRNIEYGLRIRRIKREEMRRRVENALNMMNLIHLAERDARTLSGGEAQRVSLARLIAIEPRLSLLDEPTSALDKGNVPMVEEAIIALREKGSTVIVATHQIEQAYRLSANVVRLESGRIVPSALENIFEGEVVEKDGLPVLLLSNGLSIHIVTEKRGVVRASIDPSSIILSKERLVSSARNSFPGKVVALSQIGEKVSLSLDIGVRLSVHITKESFEDLALNLGSEVFATFKASAVTVF